MREGAQSAWGSVRGWERDAEGAERSVNAVLAFISAKMNPMARTIPVRPAGTNPPWWHEPPLDGTNPPLILGGLARGGVRPLFSGY